MYSETQKAVLRTISFFDIFKYPLTAAECWRLLYFPANNNQGCALSVIEKDLENLNQAGVLKKINNFWQLKSSPDYYFTRQERYLISEKKIKKIKYWKHIFTWIPSVRFVAIVNSVGYRNAEVGDDIDLFIITKSGQLWLTRGWLTGLAKLLGVRPTLTHQQDGLCLSFYLGDDHLQFDDLLITSPDVYFHFWFTQMTVLFDDGVGEKLINKNDEWGKYFPNLDLQFIATTRFNIFDRIIRSLGYLLTLSIWEKFWRMAQIAFLPKRFKVSSHDKGVIINNQVLKFHDHDTRESYKKTWLLKIKDLGI